MLVTYKCISYTVIDMQVNVIIELETLLSPQKRLKAAYMVYTVHLTLHKTTINKTSEYQEMYICLHYQMQRPMIRTKTIYHVFGIILYSTCQMYEYSNVSFISMWTIYHLYIVFTFEHLIIINRITQKIKPKSLYYLLRKDQLIFLSRRSLVNVVA